MTVSWFLVERRLRSASDEVGIGATLEELRAAENVLGITFPDAFRAFLTSCGWAAVGSRELYGLGKDVPPFLDLCAITISERVEATPALPSDLIPLTNDGAGNLFCIRANVTRTPVVFWNHELSGSQIPEHIADDYLEWLAESIDCATS